MSSKLTTAVTPNTTMAPGQPALASKAQFAAKKPIRQGSVCVVILQASHISIAMRKGSASADMH